MTVKPSKGRKGDAVHSHPFPIRSSMPQAEAPAGAEPTGMPEKPTTMSAGAKPKGKQPPKQPAKKTVAKRDGN